MVWAPFFRPKHRKLLQFRSTGSGRDRDVPTFSAACAIGSIVISLTRIADRKNAAVAVFVAEYALAPAIEAGWPRRGTRLGAQHESAAPPQARALTHIQIQNKTGPDRTG
jgi:hypothetical protein